ncbi:MAG TPA: LytR family transcriptional regulator, partial [Candidatus Mediterraneibacter stercoravium]|nr:LytR family transcriptional regulator [Candidatus Mediterraneibacter stercoravium]
MSQRDDIQRRKKKVHRRRSSSGSETHATGSSARRRNTSHRRKSSQSRHEEKNNKISRNTGLVIAVIQLIATIVFMAGLFVLNMLPNMYLAAIGILLFLFWGIILASQFFSKKNAIMGKVISIIITVFLIIGSYFLFKTSGTISNITGGEYKLDNVVVAVMKDDPAESIQDAADYTFGVQYQMNGDQIRDTIDAINSELGSEIRTQEYNSLAE